MDGSFPKEQKYRADGIAGLWAQAACFPASRQIGACCWRMHASLSRRERDWDPSDESNHPDPPESPAGQPPVCRQGDRQVSDVGRSKAVVSGGAHGLLLDEGRSQLVGRARSDQAAAFRLPGARSSGAHWL